ncbi:serine hydrolase [Cecembia sp.]|uniref:serine hydrolase n=1 Tax=Cecembia sp. TaxID=1898110 RepID=UPI0025C176C5|nr:serine hydrolase [Cecembia sp.]
MRKTTTLLLLSFLAIGNLIAQELDRKKLDSYFDLITENDRAMGSVTLRHEGNVIYQRAFGYADIEKGQSAALESKYRVGSISKTFTAVLIFKAIEEGKLSLDQPISSFFPEIKNAEKITISDLLNHRSGIFSFTSRPDYLSWSSDPKSRAALYEMMLEGNSIFEPGSKAEYSNSNYVLLTWILEDTYKKSYSDLLKEIIIQPLSLQNTYVGEAFAPDNKEVLSYKFLGEWQQENITDMSIPLGAGAIISTPEDLTVFIRALFSEKLISPVSLSQMTELKDNYGRGLFKYPFHEEYAYGHDGGIDGFRSSLSFFPELDLTYSLTLNAVNMDPNQISIAVLSAFFGKEYDLPSFSTPTLSEDELDAMVGVYAAAGFPLEITIKRQNLTLIAQASGQPEFPLEHIEGNTFVFRVANLSMEFHPEAEEMSFEQGGMKFTMKKK